MVRPFPGSLSPCRSRTSRRVRSFYGDVLDRELGRLSDRRNLRGHEVVSRVVRRGAIEQHNAADGHDGANWHLLLTVFEFQVFARRLREAKVAS
ncbi:MAG: hypothetical protein JWM85_3243 [Acidimicrobiaceae bacterium]|nr:hypothetical protein [Acidimicrobiaceae bacterium]